MEWPYQENRQIVCKLITEPACSLNVLVMNWKINDYVDYLFRQRPFLRQTHFTQCYVINVKQMRN